MIRRIGKCGACKKVSARDYTDTKKISTGAGTFRRDTTIYGITLHGHFKRVSDDSTCPDCGSPRWAAKQVNGFTTEHRCAAKCLNSKGNVCECSCGGRNHGAGWLVCDAVPAASTTEQQEMPAG